MDAEIVDLEKLLSNTGSLINTIFWFEHEIKKPKAASHKAVAIKYIDIKEMRDSFIRELKSTASNWVYSKSKYKDLLMEELAKRGQDTQNATSYLTQIVEEKFRKGCPQGQFGELLLFNFIQFFFKAPPLLRKMPLTTNPALERHGADAIHYKSTDKSHVFILGESKCYESKYSFNKAIKNSIKSIIDSFDNIENELILYQHDGFIEPELQLIAKNLKDGKLENSRFELVCMIAYEENEPIDANNEEEIKNNIEKCIKKRWEKTDGKLYDEVRSNIIDRIHYVAFPIWSLNKILEKF